MACSVALSNDKIPGTFRITKTCFPSSNQLIRYLAMFSFNSDSDPPTTSLWGQRNLPIDYNTTTLRIYLLLFILQNMLRTAVSSAVRRSAAPATPCFWARAGSTAGSASQRFYSRYVLFEFILQNTRRFVLTWHSLRQRKHHSWQ